jgi:hypothetical protein
MVLGDAPAIGSRRGNPLLTCIVTIMPADSEFVVDHEVRYRKQTTKLPLQFHYILVVVLV